MVKRKKIGADYTHKTRQFFLLLAFCFLPLITFSQVTAEVDTTNIRIGEQITYKIKVETDSSNIVVFPEAQTFLPMELVEALKIDTSKAKDKIKLLKLRNKIL